MIPGRRKQLNIPTFNKDVGRKENRGMCVFSMIDGNEIISKIRVADFGITEVVNCEQNFEQSFGC